MRVFSPWVVLGVLLLPFAVLVAQDNARTPAMGTPEAGQRQPLSPRGQTEFAFVDGKKIVVDYGRPYMRGRKIMGGLVPYGQWWRTGANAATSFETQTNLQIGDARVPAGKYTLYTIPGEPSWTIIFNKQTGQWGTQYDQSQDLARISVKAARLQQPVDQFTISFQPRGAGGRPNEAGVGEYLCPGGLQRGQVAPPAVDRTDGIGCPTPIAPSLGAIRVGIFIRAP